MPSAASYNDTSWYSDLDGSWNTLLVSLYYKEPALQEVIPAFWGSPLFIYMSHFLPICLQWILVLFSFLGFCE